MSPARAPRDATPAALRRALALGLAIVLAFAGLLVGPAAARAGAPAEAVFVLGTEAEAPRAGTPAELPADDGSQGLAGDHASHAGCQLTAMGCRSAAVVAPAAATALRYRHSSRVAPPATLALLHLRPPRA